MKNLFIFTLLLFGTLTAKTQVVSGLYSGTLFNDTTKMLQSYQLALSEYKGKITGYSYTTFVANDTFYYGIRKIKAFVKNNELIIEDDKMLVNNFPESPSKGVKRMSVIPMNLQEDTLSSLSGRWETNKTKQYYAVSGSLRILRDNDSSQSALINHLKELKIIGANNELQPINNAPAMVQSKPKEVKEIKRSEPSKAIVKTKKKEETLAKSSEPEKSTTVAITPVVITHEQRKERVMQTIDFAGDSLMLSFYDNGVVDGDVISVYVNGENVISNAKLTEVALKKTIYVKAGSDSLQIKLVAENLGSLPPNTGLLIVQDGSNKYNVNFSADLQTNASIVFRKRK